MKKNYISFLKRNKRKIIYINISLLSAILLIFYIIPLACGIFAPSLSKTVGADYCEFVEIMPKWYTNRMLLLNLKSNLVPPKSKSLLFYSALLFYLQKNRRKCKVY